jgi:hypothetical protein
VSIDNLYTEHELNITKVPALELRSSSSTLPMPVASTHHHMNRLIIRVSL